MSNREAIIWCWCGLATAVLAGMALTSAGDLLSPSERLIALDLGPWLDWSELGGESVRWQFALTPLAAWCLAACGGLCGWIGWKAQQAGALLPFGLLGCLIWLASWGLLTVESLPLAWLFLSIQTWLCIIWLMKQDDVASEAGDLRPFVAAQLAADICGLAGVLLAGLAWGTFDLAMFRDPEFVYAGWKQNPLACGAAGGWLFLGFACRCGWFPWLPATRVGQIGSVHVDFGWHVPESSTGVAMEPRPRPSQSLRDVPPKPIHNLQLGMVWSAALMFGGLTWPAVGWWWLVISPLLGCAPEIVSFVQGSALLAALIAAFVATAQTDRRRTVVLLVSMQFGLIASAAVLPSIVSTLELAIVIGSLCLIAAWLMMTTGASSGGRWAWWLLAGGCLSPMFWMAGVSAERFPSWNPPARESVASDDQAATSEDATSTEVYRVQPLPTATWAGAWCLTSFFAAFAARRAAAENVASKPESAHHDWVAISAMTLLAGIAAWMTWEEIITGELWPGLLATISGLAGWSLASAICRDADQIEARFSGWGLWVKFSQQSSFLDDGALASCRRMLARLSNSAHRTEEVGPMFMQAGWSGVAAQLKAAVEELRNEPPGVYAVAFALVVGSMIATWMWLLEVL